VHKSVALHEFEQVRFDMRPNDAIGLNNRAGLRINIVPEPSDLRVKPAL
jgi:hypothetical protein